MSSNFVDTNFLYFVFFLLSIQFTLILCFIFDFAGQWIECGYSGGLTASTTIPIRSECWPDTVTTTFSHHSKSPAATAYPTYNAIASTRATAADATAVATTGYYQISYTSGMILYEWVCVSKIELKWIYLASAGYNTSTATELPAWSTNSNNIGRWSANTDDRNGREWCTICVWPTQIGSTVCHATNATASVELAKYAGHTATVYSGNWYACFIFDCGMHCTSPIQDQFNKISCFSHRL